MEDLNESLGVRLGRVTVEYLGLSFLYDSNYKSLKRAMGLRSDLFKYTQVNKVLADVLLMNIDEQSDAERIYIGKRGTGIIKKIFMRNGLTEDDFSYGNLKECAKKSEKMSEELFGGETHRIFQNLERLYPHIYKAVLVTLDKKFQRKSEKAKKKTTVH